MRAVPKGLRSRKPSTQAQKERKRIKSGVSHFIDRIGELKGFSREGLIPVRVKRADSLSPVTGDGLI